MEYTELFYLPRFAAGSGSDRRSKAIAADDHGIVSLAISDPLLMTALPADITASAGRDALTQRHMNGRLVSLAMPSLKETGFDPADIPALADMAMNDPTPVTNPVQPSSAEMISLIESIYCEELK